MNSHSASEKILFDFQAETNLAAWQIVNDDVMGGVSTSAFRATTNGTALFTGHLSLENNGGFASVRSLPRRTDLTGCGSFLIRLRGDGRGYKFTVRTDSNLDSPLYQAAFPTQKGEWKELRLPFNRFVPTFRGRVLNDVPPLNPAQVTSVGILIADKQEGPFRLEISSVKAAPATP
jgi:hypothetical protein